MSSEEEVQPAKLVPTSVKVFLTIVALVSLLFAGYKAFTYEKPAPIDTVAQARETVQKAGFMILNDRQHRKLGKGRVAVPVDMESDTCTAEIVATHETLWVIVWPGNGSTIELDREEISLAADKVFKTAPFAQCYPQDK